MRHIPVALFVVASTFGFAATLRAESSAARVDITRKPPATQAPAARDMEEEAKAVASANVAGVVDGIRLERRRGKLAYLVKIVTADGQTVDAKVDAGTLAFLGTEPGQAISGNRDLKSR